VIEFHYRHWAGFDVGSTVTFEGGAGFMEVTATLLERDAEKVVLLIRCSLGRRSLDFPETLRAQSPPAERPLREGREVIVVAGEEWLSRWVETVKVKSWFVDQVPGGIARWEVLGPEPLTWSVKAFRRT
jgi:hypothetical protein